MTTVTTQAAQAPYILAIDVGTSSVRALLFDAQARVIEGIVAQETYNVISKDDGSSEIDPASAFQRVVRCIDQALQQAGNLADGIAAVALDTLVTSTIAIDKQGQALTALITYADTRATSASEQLRQQLDERHFHNRTGCLLRASYWPARLAWLRQNNQLWASVHKWITFGEYIELHLFGESRISYSAAAWTGLLDRQKLCWDEELLAALGESSERLGQLVDLDQPLDQLRNEYQQRWPALQGKPWYPAIGDGAAANIGSGGIGHQRMALTVGTTGAIRVAQPHVEQVPEGLWCYRVDRKLSLLGGATSEGGNVYAWMRSTLQLGDSAAIEQEIAAMAPDSHGLTILPLLAGERSPGWAGDAKACINGLTLATTPIQILQASLESVAYRFALIEQRMCTDANCNHQLIASGGALLHSPAWLQIIANVIGRPVVASAEPEATSRGVALLALRSLGIINDLAELPATDGKTYEPNPQHHQHYQAAIERQQKLYKLIIQ
jgi:gluconokinase